MIAIVIALCCAGLAVVAFRREGRPVTFMGADFRTLVAHDTYTVDWATGAVTDLAVDSTVTDTTETTGRWGGIAAAAVYTVKARAKHDRRRRMYFSELERFGSFIKAQQPLEIDQPPRDPSTCPDEESI